MPTGDSLTIATVLFGAVLTCMVGAIAAPPGWRSNALFALTGLFVLITLGWLFPPTQIKVLVLVLDVIVAAAQSGALVMIGTVSVVAIMGHWRKPARFDLGSLEIAPEKSDSHVIAALQSAKDDAAIAASQGGPRGAERTLPRVRAALLTAKKHFDIQLPPETGRADVDMQTGQRFIEQIVPFLRHGHIAEARDEAISFIARLKG